MAKKTTKPTTLANLVAAYNEIAPTIGRKPVKSFKSIEAAEKRVKAAMLE